jgi:hypothetical protein
MDIVNTLKPCSQHGCTTIGYFSHKFKAVLCDRHYFERNGQPDQSPRNVVTTSHPTEGKRL